MGVLLASAALNILLYHDAAVSEHRAGHVGEQRPCVRGGLIGLHVAQRWPLTADNAPCRVNLAIQHHGTVGRAGGALATERAPRTWRQSLRTGLVGAASPLCRVTADLAVLCPLL